MPGTRMIYFDHNATAPLHPAARDAWLRAHEEFVGNPSSPHRLGARAEAALSDARERLARLLGCQGSEIVWTSGATESNNLVFHHFAAALPSEAEVWISAIEHPSVSEPAARFFAGRLRTIPVDREGVADVQWLEERMRERRPGLVALMAANNVTGVCQPWTQAAALCRSQSVPFFCDAVQWVGKEPSGDWARCDFVSGCGHKVGGPRGIGFLKCPDRGRLHAQLYGGPQEEGRRAGTENVAGALALVAVLEARERSLRNSEVIPRRSWRERFEAALIQELSGVEILGQGRERLWNTVAARMPDCEGPHRWLVKLDKQGFAASAGSACSSGREKASPVLLAMGCDPSEAGRVLRFSSGWESQCEDWMALLQALKSVARQLGSPGPEGRAGSVVPRAAAYCALEAD
ncbi:MAG: aminotransferase class V-fold PLP-dependent enzyme [Verrucomicrobiae bacterium]|nr:aminotransferase class V-fold PLP-dependent enzyme [Verrucomicrobiae bacterium]